MGVGAQSETRATTRVARFRYFSLKEDRIRYVSVVGKSLLFGSITLLYT